jgi:hypothetical protein
MSRLIGNQPNQVPTCGMLSPLAFADPRGLDLPAMPRVNGDLILESGSNANGHFVRLASGLQICRYSDPTARTTSTGSGSIFVSAAQAYTFPAAFVGDLTALQVMFSARDSSGAPCWASGTWSLTGVSAVHVVSASSAATARPAYVAIGRWKV